MTRDPWRKIAVAIARLVVIAFLILTLATLWSDEPPTTGTASWYDRESCRREGTSGVTASGEELHSERDYTCAIWKLNGKPVPFGTVLKVTHGDRAVWVRCTDRGPSKRLVKRGRIIDLSKRAFERLAPLSAGVIEVTVEPHNEEG